MEREIRCVVPEGVDLEERASGGTVIRGYAAIFGVPADLGYFTESVEEGAFKDALQSSDVRALFNHDANLLLGRTKSGTLRAREDKRGLWYEVDAPDTQVGRDTVQSIKRGDITGNSFSFTVREEEWEPLDEKMPDGTPKMHRKILAVDRLFDLGPVTYPAYDQTVVSARSEERARAEARRLGLAGLEARRAARARDLDIAEKL